MEVKKIKRYSQYKDSGIKWLGEIPERWKYMRMKRLFYDYSEKNKPDEELLSVTQTQGVVPRSLVENRMVMPNGNLETFKYIQRGDFAISLRSFEGGLEYSNYNGIISPAYTVLKLKTQVEHNFFKYLFKSNSFIQELQTSVVGIREGKNISYSELSYSFLPFPPLVEQRSIAAYLDKKTEEIDIAIAQKEQMIELLKERKQILINCAVTRGLNPDVTLKDSGVDWIGEIPEHWEVRRLGNFSKVIDPQPDHRAPEIDINGFPYLGIRDINSDGTINIETARMVKETALLKQESAFVINDEDIVFCKVGTLGEPKHIKIKGERVALSATLVLIKIADLFLSRYIKYCLDSNFIYNQINVIITGATRPALGIQQIRKFILPIPSDSDMKDIVIYLDKNLEKIDKAIFQKQEEIEKLKEYKSTLIDSAVTGKICLVN